MLTVPVTTASLVLNERDRALVQDFQVLAGRRWQVDVSSLAQHFPDLATSIARAAAEVGSGPHAYRVRLLAASQVSGGASKKDLTELYDALKHTPACSSLLRAATDPRPDDALLFSLASALGGSFAVLSEDTREVTILTQPSGFPDALGGPPHPHEHSREITLKVMHAPWRDRRIRRLAGVTVSAVIRSKVIFPTD